MIKVILRTLAIIGLITVIPVFLYFIFTGKNYLEIFDKIDEL